ncbi:hypothetical protein ZWY2020_038709 [Hordeum vulgare]|nr:hypothetical protein ZWY2020_038709 [Hordeum vulgare]
MTGSKDGSHGLWDGHPATAADADADAVYLHGILEVTVFEADHLHNAIHGQIIKATESLEQSLGVHCLQRSRLYVDIDVGAAQVARSCEWAHGNTPSQHLIGASVLSHGSVPTASVAAGAPRALGRPPRRRSRTGRTPSLRVWLQFLDVELDPCWDAGIRLPGYAGIRPAFFPGRTNCSVTLYQNSHLSNGFDPSVRLDGGQPYRPARLWEDLYVAIRDARHFVYVAGWSVNTAITLVRDASRMIPGAEGVTLGELLKRKADEGRDEQTRAFFHGTNVRCFLCPRDADAALTLVQSIEISTEFTHHQKTVTLDAATPGTADGRHVVSFIGGIDLCDGRTTRCSGSSTTYSRDFMQNNFRHASLRYGGPREPWHDVHCRLEGPAAWDVLANFEHRWKKQAPGKIRGCLLDLSPETFPDPCTFDNDDGTGSWNVQVLRSVDDASVVRFPTDPGQAAAMGLTSGKNLTIDRSIQISYVRAIRRARQFIYIENQYFLGGCASWAEDRDSGCLNLVPVEIALKVAAKIRRGERFAVYVVTPMWPEGEPASDSIQAIVRWNRLTVEMMYGIVMEAIDDAELRGQAHPCDYLNFFCLGNREARRPAEYVPPANPEKGTDYWRAQASRRSPIYVHAKLMIVDDEYVIVGSANLNERSLAGNQDSEIAQELPASAPERAGRQARPGARAGSVCRCGTSTS